MISKIAIATGAALLFIGCTQPDFNPGNKGLVFQGGKPYAIPYGSSYGIVTDQFLQTLDMAKKDQLRAGNQRMYQILMATTCKRGEVSWTEKETKQKFVSFGDSGKAYEFLYQAFKSGKAGCARPLNQQEYNYYLNQQNQQAANNRAAIQGQAARDQEYYNNINNSANQQIQQRNEQFYRDNYILNRMGY